MKYLSNLNGLHFGEGDSEKVYDQGDEIKVGKGDEGAIGILAERGHVTVIEDGDAPVTSNGESSNAAGDPFDHDGDGKPGGSKAKPKTKN